MGLLDRLSHAWNAFVGNDIYYSGSKFKDLGYSSSIQPYRTYFSRGNDRSIVTAIYTRIAVDCMAIDYKHVRLDDNNRFIEEIQSKLNYCLTVEANKDQTAKALLKDIVISMFDEGVVAVVPIDTTFNPSISSSYDIETLRTGRITQWYPDHVRVEVYNDRTGQKKELTFAKKDVAIIENPLYEVINAPNSTLQRLLLKLNILDAIDKQSGSGKLDLIIQLPYVIKSKARQDQAAQRRADIESQLANSKFGIAYTDGTEKITQLNRPVENNLMAQIQYLTTTLYSQLGVTEEVLLGTADEKTMLNYQKRTVEPIANAIADEFNRKFLTKTARSQKQKIMYFNDPFKLIPVSNLADIADKFTRNEIMSSNEIRQIIGMKPVSDPRADELRNKNLNAGEGQEYANTNGYGQPVDQNQDIQEANYNGGNQNG